MSFVTDGSPPPVARLPAEQIEDNLWLLRSMQEKKGKVPFISFSWAITVILYLPSQCLATTCPPFQKDATPREREANATKKNKLLRCQINKHGTTESSCRPHAGICWRPMACRDSDRAGTIAWALCPSRTSRRTHTHSMIKLPSWAFPHAVRGGLGGFSCISKAR